MPPVPWGVAMAAIVELSIKRWMVVVSHSWCWEDILAKNSTSISLSILFGGSIFFRKYYKFSIIPVPHALCSHPIIVLQSKMDDSSVMRIHLTNRYRFSGSLWFFCHSLGHPLEICFPCLKIAFHIYLHPDSGCNTLIDDFFNKILYCLKGLPAFSNQNSGITPNDFK